MDIMISTLDAEQDPLDAVFQYHVTFGDGKSDRIHAGSDLVVRHSYPRNGSFVVTMTAGRLPPDLQPEMRSIKIVRSGNTTRTDRRATTKELAWVPLRGDRIADGIDFVARGSPRAMALSPDAHVAKENPSRLSARTAILSTRPAFGAIPGNDVRNPGLVAAAEDKHFDGLARRSDARPARGRDPHRRPASGPGRRGLGQDAGHHPPRRPSALTRGSRPTQILAVDLHQQGGRRDARADRCPGAASRVWVGTFHGFCARLLRKYSPLVGIDPGFSIYDQNDRLRAVKDVMEQVGWDEPGWTPERVESAISRAKNDLRQPRQPGSIARRSDGAGSWPRSTRPTKSGSAWPRPSISTTCWSTWSPSSRNTRTSAPSSTGGSATCWSMNIKIRTWRSTRSSAPCRSTTPTSASPATPTSRSTAGAGPICRTSWNSSKTIPGCRVVTLERNYRSTKNILSVADHLIRYNRNRKPKVAPHREPARRAGRADRLPARDRRGRRGRRQDRRAGPARGNIGFADIAVFCRMTALTRPFEQAFRSARIPYQIVGGVAFYERQEVKDVLAYLNLMVNPKDDMAFARVVNVPPRGLGKTSLEHLSPRRASEGCRSWRWRGRPASSRPQGKGRARARRLRPA